MARNRVKSNSKNPRRKCGEVDRMSELPDEIIIAILSLLPFREAVATSILSSRWLDLWKHTSNLELDSIEMVNSILSSHKSPSLKQLRISLNVDESIQREIAKWLEFVFSRQIENLELDFQHWGEIHKVSLGINRDQKLVKTTSLKSLCLSCVELSGEDLGILLRNCPLLEQLSISSATVTSDVEICSEKLNRLEMICCSGGESIRVSAPNLGWIRVDDASGKMMFEKVPALVEAEFVNKCDWLDDVNRFASAVFGFVSQLRSLHLTLRYPKEFLANELPEMSELKKLVVVYTGSTKYDLRPVTSLLWACPRLEEFRVECTSIWMQVPLYIEVARKVERSSHPNLKVFEMIGLYRGADDHIELVNYILDNCGELKKIIIAAPRYSYSYPLRRFDRRKQTDAAINYAKQQLHGKVPHHIHLDFVES